MQQILVFFNTKKELLCKTKIKVILVAQDVLGIQVIHRAQKTSQTTQGRNNLPSHQKTGK